MQPGREGHRRPWNMADNSGQARAPTPPPPPPPLPPPPPPSPPPPQSPLPIGTWYAVHSDNQGEKNCYCDDSTDEVRREVSDSKAMPVALNRPKSRDGDDSAFGGRLDNLRGAVTDRPRSTVVVSKDVKLQSNEKILSSRGSSLTRCAALVPLSKRNAVAGTSCNAGPSYLRGQRQTNPDQQERSAFPSCIASQPPSRQTDLKQSTTHTLEYPRPSRESVYLSNSSSSGVSNDLTSISEDARRGYPKKGIGCPEEESLEEKQVEERSPSPLWMTMVREDETSESSGSISRHGSRVPSVLLEAEDWLNKNDPEYDRCPTTIMAGGKKMNSYSSRGRASALPHYWPGVEGSQRVKTAADESTMREAKRQEVEEVTCRPEITRLGRSKRRSVHDLFLYQLNVEETRRRKQDEIQTTEDRMRTHRPETCTKSKLLVERMRRRRCDNTHVPTSERLYNEGREQRRRREDRRERLETAVRLRASPKLTASRGVLSPDRGDVGQRLYEQALQSRQDAREREQIARHAQRGATFHPEITTRSVLLARRRRRATCGIRRQGGAGGGETGGVSRHLVEEVLLAEGVIYEQRRRQRLQRQEEINGILRRSATVNHHSTYLLRKVQKRGFMKVAVACVIRPDRSRTWKTTADIDEMEQATFSPTLEARGASNKILKSRYGQGALPSMEERAKEWDMRCLERRKRLAGRERLAAGSARGRMNRKKTESSPASNVLGFAGVNRSARRSSDIYKRSTEYVRQRDRRRAAQREARLAEEMTDCTFEPCLSTRLGSRGNHARRHRPSSTSSDRIHSVGRDDNTGSSVPPSSSRTSRGPRDPGRYGYHRSGQRGNESALTVRDRDALKVNHRDELRIERITDEGVARSPALPSGWFHFITPEGRVYYFFADTGLVQWERPTE